MTRADKAKPQVKAPLLAQAVERRAADQARRDKAPGQAAKVGRHQASDKPLTRANAPKPQVRAAVGGRGATSALTRGDAAKPQVRAGVSAARR